MPGLTDGHGGHLSGSVGGHLTSILAAAGEGVGVDAPTVRVC